jgi:predicted phosphodiesterase
MRYAVLADIHGNVEALRAVLEAARALGVDRLAACGDLVGGHASPGACLDLLRRAGAVSVAGNHDLAAAGREESGRATGGGPRARAPGPARLRPEHRRYLAGLPTVQPVDGAFVLCHGTLASPHERVRGPADAALVLAQLRREYAPVRLCFFGHTHVPAAYGERRGAVEAIGGRRFQLEPGVAYLVNPGSVGQPRDGDLRASFALFDSAAARVSVERVPYARARARVKLLVRRALDLAWSP